MGSPKFFYETHLHTFESSRCGVTYGSLMAEHHVKLGFTGVFVTDHFATGNSHGNIDAPWNERIDIMCAGYQSVKAQGDKMGLDVFFAWEYPFEGGDFLTYGLDIDFLYAHPELADLHDFPEYARLVHHSGGFIVQAHPFREAAYIPNGRAVLQQNDIDAIEVYNGSHRNPDFNEMALKKAIELNFPMIAGSDTHSIEMSGTSFVAADHRLKNVQDFIAQVKEQKIELIIPEHT